MTNGHLDIVGRAAKLYDEVVVAVLINKSKAGMFTVDELAGFSDRSFGATRALVNALSLMNTLKVATPRDTGAFSPQMGLGTQHGAQPAFSGATLKDAAGKTIPASAAVGAAGITLIAPMLRPGAYTVEWHSVGHDTHRVSGHFTFKVLP